MEKIFKDLHNSLIMKLSSEDQKTKITNAFKMMTTENYDTKVKTDEGEITLSLKKIAVGPLLINHKRVWMYQFHVNDEWKIYNVLTYSKEFNIAELKPLFDSPEILLRIDSGCLTGQLFGDETCDCNSQLHVAIKEIISHNQGLIIHIPNQDGRGKGLGFKLSTLYLQQELKLNTVEAAALLANDKPIDDRTYDGVIAILKYFNINNTNRIILNTNNPDKTKVLIENNYNVEIKKSKVKANKKIRKHLKAKKKYLKHTL